MIHCNVLNGSMSVEDRDAALREFREYSNIFISTDTGGEGLNLHIGIENIRASRLRKLAQEKTHIEEAHKAGSQICPDFKLAFLIRLEV